MSIAKKGLGSPSTISIDLTSCTEKEKEKLFASIGYRDGGCRAKAILRLIEKQNSFGESLSAQCDALHKELEEARETIKAHESLLTKSTALAEQFYELLVLQTDEDEITRFIKSIREK